MRCTVVVTGVGECMNRLRSPGPALVCPCPPLQCTLHTADIVYIACHIYELHNALSTVYCTSVQGTVCLFTTHCTLWSLDHASVCPCPPSVPSTKQYSSCILHTVNRSGAHHHKANRGDDRQTVPQKSSTKSATIHTNKSYDHIAPTHQMHCYLFFF